MESADPKSLFHLECQQANFVVLPILDKIIKKTLCLQNYTLSAGHCQGLAAACSQLDSDKINRILFNNCGINGS